MQITTYAAASEFLARSQEILECHEAANNLILGLANMIVRSPERFAEFYLLTVDDSSKVQLAALMTPPNNLIIHAEVPEALSVLALHCFAEKITLPGVVGLVESAHAFAHEWVNAAGGSWSVRMHERVYELRQVIAPTLVPGQLIAAELHHQDIVVQWLDAFHAEALPESVQMADSQEMAKRAIAERKLSLWVVAGEPVSMAVGPNRHSRAGVYSA